MNTYRIVLADDHALFRQGLRNIVESEGDLEIVGEARDGLDLLDQVKKVTPDLVILDISMPHLRGIEAIREIRVIIPNVKVLILTMHKDKDFLYHAISSGADGYLLKEDADTELFAAIENIRHGGHYISPLLAGESTYALIQTSHMGQMVSPPDILTLREREILKLIAEGFSNKKVADSLCISIRTVENHRANIMRKLNIKETANLVKYAIRKGYTSSSK